jgi:hypothetical protein
MRVRGLAAYCTFNTVAIWFGSAFSASKIANCVVSIAARHLSINTWTTRCFSMNWSRLRWNVPTAACKAAYKDRILLSVLAAAIFSTVCLANGQEPS